MVYENLSRSLADVIIWHEQQGNLMAIQGLTSLGAAALKALGGSGTLVGCVMYITLEVADAATELLDSIQATVYVM